MLNTMIPSEQFAAGSPVTGVTEHLISAVHPNPQYSMLRIEPDAITFCNAPNAKDRRLTREEAERIIRFSTTQSSEINFSVKLESSMKYRCSRAALETLQRWFGYEGLLRMELRPYGLFNVVFGAYLLYQNLHFFLSADFTVQNFLTLLTSILIVLGGLASRLFPSRHVFLFIIASWLALALRYLYLIMTNGHLIFFGFAILSIGSTYFLLRKYIALSKLQRVLSPFG